MALKEPGSMDECVYFTRRAEGGSKVMAWVLRKPCQKCKKGMMGKPLDEKTGKPKIRAKDYVCPSCKHTVEKAAYEATLEACIRYTCQKCGHSGETTVPFTRKAWQGVKAIVYSCEKCKEKWGVTKKMKAPKRKGAAADEDADADDDDF